MNCNAYRKTYNNERASLFSSFKSCMGSSGMRILRYFYELQETLQKRESAYGIADKNSFGDLAKLFAFLFAYDNKHFYVYRALADSSKIGFLSRKQYYKLHIRIKKLKNIGEDECYIQQVTNEYLENNGTMASPFKMFKDALISNSRTRMFASRFKVLDVHSRKISNSDELESFAKILFEASMPLKLEESDNVQRCYDVELPDSYEFSDKRFCTHSCMEHSDVGDFYDAFPTKGVLVKNGDEEIGRFLLWTLPDGKKYVDRLYIRSAFSKTALAVIDKTYPDAIKYPALTDKPENSMSYNIEPYFIHISNVEKLLEANQFPWIDTFAHLYRDKQTGEYVLSNISRSKANELGLLLKYYSVCTLRGFSRPNITICPKCGKLLFGGADKRNYGKIHDILYCNGYKTKSKTEAMYLGITKDFIQMEENENGERKTGTETFESLFGL